MNDKAKREGSIPCDFCAQPTSADHVDAWGIAKCNVCLAEEVIERADGVIVAWQVDDLRNAVKQARELWQQGNTGLAIMAGRAAWNLALGLHNALESKIDVQTGRRARKQRSDAGFSSGTERAAARKPEWDRWQAEADKQWSKNHRLSVIQVARRIAPKFHPTKADTIRKRIKNSA